MSISHGIKLFPTETGKHRFIATNDGWTAESGASIYATASSIAAQNALHVLASTTLAGAISPLLTLVGSETPVRVEALYKTLNSSQTANVSVLDQAGTVIASTTFATSAYSTTFNDYKRAIVDVTVPSGVTGVQARICLGNNIAGEMTVDEALLSESVLLYDPDDISRVLNPTKATHVTLSGRRTVDVLHRHYAHQYRFPAMTPEVYNRAQSYLFRNEALRLDDGDVPANQEVFTIYAKGLIDYSNVQSLYNAGGVVQPLWAQTLVDSRMPNDSGFGSAVTSWAQAAVTNATTTTGASIATSTNSTYTYAQLFFPTVGSSLGNFDRATTFAVDVVSEVQSTASGAYGFDVWAYDWSATLWRRIKTVVRTGQVNVVVDMRSSDMLAKFQDVTGASNPMKFLFRTRATNRGPGAKLTFKNVTLFGNRGFDPAYTSAASMGNYGAYYVKTKDKPKAISWVQIDNRESQYVSAPQTLTAGVDYIVAPEGVVFPIPTPNLHINSINGAKVLVRYTRDFLVSGESLPETWYRTGDLTGHHRAVSVSFTDLRASVEDDLNL